MEDPHAVAVPALIRNAAIVLVVASVIGYVTLSSMSADAYAGKAKEAIFGEYDLGNAQSLYEKALQKDPTHKESLFNLARIQYITGRYDESFETIATYKKAYPDEKRVHYIAGLAHAFAGNLDDAEREMKAFVDSDIAGWQGHLDLAWIQFKKGDIEVAKETLVTGIDVFGGNAFLNTSLGGVLVALGEYEDAEKALLIARAQMDLVTKDEWRQNFSFNNPRGIDNRMGSMRASIDANIALAQSKGESGNLPAVARALSYNFISASPLGHTKGLVVSACGGSDSCETIACVSTPNACGQVSAGTYQSCTISGDSSCNASTPGLPNGYGETCQVTNSCGNTSSGTIGCDGQCSATPPGSCDPFAPSISAGSCTVGELYIINISATDSEGENIRYGIDWDNDGSIDQYAPTEGYVSSGSVQTVGNVFGSEGVKTIRVRTENESGSNSSFVSHSFVCSEGDGSALLGGDGGEGGEGGIDGALVANPLLVRSGNTTTLIWDTEGVDSCTVVGTNGDLFNGVSGTRSSGPITEQTLFTLNCDDGAVTDSVTVNVVPIFEEQ